jgi:hypothetical protein
MNPASEAQLRRLAAHGKLEDKDYSIKEASDLIGSIVDTKEEPNWDLADQNRNLIWKINTRQTKKAIKALEKQTANEDLPKEAREDLSEELEEYQERIKEIAEEKEEWKESQQEDKEDKKYRIKEYQEELGPHGEWSKYIKKPNQTQVKQCLEALDKQHPDWEHTKGAEALVATLISNFPEVKKKNAPLPNESKGCLSIIVMGLIISIFFATKLIS